MIHPPHGHSRQGPAQDHREYLRHFRSSPRHASRQQRFGLGDIPLRVGGKDRDQVLAGRSEAAVDSLIVAERRTVELPRICSEGSDPRDKLATGSEFLDAMEIGVSDEDIPERIHGQAVKRMEFALAFSTAARPLAQSLAIRREHLKALVPIVSYIHPGIVTDGNPVGHPPGSLRSTSLEQEPAF